MNNIKICNPQFFILFFLFVIWGSPVSSQGIIIDHTSTDITKIPESAITQAKTTLHIGYGHTSHGSQLTTGMIGLVGFSNNGGLGLSHPQDIFKWNNGGTGGALDLEEGDGYGSGWLDHDCGYYPAWVNETRDYLNDPSHSDVNVIIWSWCGQASGRLEQQMIDTYLAPMSQLEIDYPNVTFVYMTGHADGSGESGNLHLRNQQIRNYCITNNKVLYDFYDIECYDPDGNYFGDKNVSDDCFYTGGNWATEWQNSHTEGVDWYSCSSAHSEPLNANRKAYAVWWLWAVLAGWNPATNIDESQSSYLRKFELYQNYPNPFNSTTKIGFQLHENSKVKITIFSSLGKKVANILDRNYQAGYHSVIWNGKDELDNFVPSGLYFYQIKTNSYLEQHKMIMMK